MSRYIAFLRAINVGGHTVRNDELRGLFAALGLGDPTPFQASGNVAFEAADAPDAGALEDRIEEHLGTELGYGVTTFVRTVDEVASLAAARPFGELPDGAKLHVAFLRRPPTSSEVSELATIATAVDRFTVVDRQLLWQVDGPFMDSPLSSPPFQRALAQPTTLRTQSTLERLARRFAG